MSMYSYDAPAPKVFAGPPPKVIVQDPSTGDWQWGCECGAVGTSSSDVWAQSDVNRHRFKERCEAYKAATLRL